MPTFKYQAGLFVFKRGCYNYGMNEAARQSKKITIALVFFLILGGIGFLIYRLVAPTPPNPPTPTPASNLVPLRVIFTKLFNVQNNDYDFLAKVYNPNISHGSGNVEYEITFYNAGNQQISIKTGSFYILPGQTKYVIDSPLRFQAPVSRTEIKIKSVDWQKLDPIAASGVSLLVKNASYSQVNQIGAFAKAGGDIFNGSDFDLNKVDVFMVLLDQAQDPIAVGKTEIRTFLAHTTRGFEGTWFAPFVGQVSRVDAEAMTNVFENSNFLRQYGGQERFKQFY